LHQVKFLKLLIDGLFSARSCNLKQISNFIPGRNKDSNYRRIQRFFAKEFDFKGIGIFCLEQFLKEVESFSTVTRRIYLIIDRVHWKVGRHDHNCLTLLVYDPELRLDFPVAFMNLGHGGNSDTGARIEILEFILEHMRPYMKRGVIEVTVLGDREFVGASWIEYLDTHGVDYVLRLRRDYELESGERVGEAYKRLSSGEVREIRGDGYRVVMTRLKRIKGRRDDCLAVMTLDMEEGGKEILGRYKMRWCIERAFFNMNSNGFNREDTHLRAAKRVEMLMYIVLLGYFLSTVTGMLLARIKSIVKKKHGYSAISIFLRGFRALQVLKNEGTVSAELQKLLDYLDIDFLTELNLLKLKENTETVV